MDIETLFNSLGLEMTGRNWAGLWGTRKTEGAEITYRVSLHLSIVGNSVIWVIVANHKTEGAGWIPLTENTTAALSTVIKDHAWCDDPILAFL